MVAGQAVNPPLDAQPAPVSVVIPTYLRTGRLLETLRSVAGCSPPPAEVIVHVEHGDETSAAAIAATFPTVRILTSPQTLGPGGARNRLLREAAYPIVVSLDDDSYPIDADFFTAACRAIAAHPRAGVVAMQIIHDDEDMLGRGPGDRLVGDFVGCGCAYRREAFLETRGYLPLRFAYGMEEADLALQLLDRNWQIVLVDDLRVRHATTRSHQANRAVTRAHIANTALLAFARYPWRFMALGIAQVLNRAVWSARHGRFAGLASGLLSIPGHIWRHRAARLPIRAETLRQSRSLQRPAGKTP